METLGEARIWSRVENRFERRTDKALERWPTVSDTSCEWRALGQQGVQEPQRQRRLGTRNLGGEQVQEQRRSVTQPHEVGFGRCPNPSTPSGEEQKAIEQCSQTPGRSSSGLSNESQRGGRGPNRWSRRGSSHAGHYPQTGSRSPSNYMIDDERSERSSRRQRRQLISPSSSPGLLDDGDR